MKIALLWTGGKDSYSAYEKVLEDRHEVTCLVTFTGNKPFLCHPLEGMQLQADALGLPHVKAEIVEPYVQGYMDVIKELVNRYRIKGIATGDIAAVDDFHGTWIDDVCKGIGVEIIRPLWGINRKKHMDDLIASGAKILFTCVLKKWFDQSWLGRTIDNKCLVELQAYSEKYGIDPCGERGEYHTMVIDSPKFSKSIVVLWQEDGETETLRYMKIDGFSSKLKKRKLIDH